MTETNDFEATKMRLAENAIDHILHRVGPNHLALIPERGAHIIGPFNMKTGESVFWLNSVMHDKAAFARFIENGEWNIGGLRLWLAPEIQFGVRDRSRYWESLYVQPTMDPGKYAFSKDLADNPVFSREMALRCHNLTDGMKEVSVRRSLRASADPASAVSGLDLSGVEYFGFVHVCELTGDPDDTASAESWNLVQVRPCGRTVVPTAGTFSYVDYYEPIDERYLSVREAGAVLTFDGQRRFKIGVHSFCHFGRMGYWRRIGSDAELIVCSYCNDPANPYSEQPGDDPSCAGLSMHFYNDGGMFGGFSELEANGHNIGTAASGGKSADSFSLWRWRGMAEKIAAIAEAFLGRGIVEWGRQ